MSQTPRIVINEVDPTAYQAVFPLEKYVNTGDLGEPLLSLVKIRASQLNGCAFCLDMHNVEARKAGVAQRKLDVISAWREASALFSDTELAALGLTEAVTLIGQSGVPDQVWNAAAHAFTDAQLVYLLMAIAAINVWNRLAIATRQALPDQAAVS